MISRFGKDHWTNSLDDLREGGSVTVRQEVAANIAPTDLAALRAQVSMFSPMPKTPTQLNALQLPAQSVTAQSSTDTNRMSELQTAAGIVAAQTPRERPTKSEDGRIESGREGDELRQPMTMPEHARRFQATRGWSEHRVSQPSGFAQQASRPHGSDFAEGSSRADENTVRNMKAFGHNLIRLISAIRPREEELRRKGYIQGQDSYRADLRSLMPHDQEENSDLNPNWRSFLDTKAPFSNFKKAVMHNVAKYRALEDSRHQFADRARASIGAAENATVLEQKEFEMIKQSGTNILGLRNQLGDHVHKAWDSVSGNLASTAAKLRQRSFGDVVLGKDFHKARNLTDTVPTQELQRVEVSPFVDHETLHRIEDNHRARSVDTLKVVQPQSQSYE
jgi:hypothetical protein